MAAWPSAAEVAARIGMGEPDANVTLARDAAVEQVQIDVGEDVETPTSSLAAAALLLAVKVLKAPDAPYGVAAVFDAGALYVARNDPQYSRLLKGQRVRFGVG